MGANCPHLLLSGHWSFLEIVCRREPPPRFATIPSATRYMRAAQRLVTSVRFPWIYRGAAIAFPSQPIPPGERPHSVYLTTRFMTSLSLYWWLTRTASCARAEAPVKRPPDMRVGHEAVTARPPWCRIGPVHRGVGGVAAWVGRAPHLSPAARGVPVPKVTLADGKCSTRARYNCSCVGAGGTLPTSGSPTSSRVGGARSLHVSDPPGDGGASWVVSASFGAVSASDC